MERPERPRGLFQERKFCNRPLAPLSGRQRESKFTLDKELRAGRAVVFVSVYRRRRDRLYESEITIREVRRSRDTPAALITKRGNRRGRERERERRKKGNVYLARFLGQTTKRYVISADGGLTSRSRSTRWSRIRWTSVGYFC